MATAVPIQARISSRRRKSAAHAGPGGDALWEHTFAEGDVIGIAAVADGLGGHPGGHAAARRAVAALERATDRLRNVSTGRIGEVLLSVGREAARECDALRRSSPVHSRAGTTLTAAVFGMMNVAVLHVGDSRFYRFDDNGAPRILTEDHSVAWRLMQEGVLDGEEMMRSPLRRRLYRYVGDGRDRFDQFNCPCSRGDRFALVTDGCVADGAELPAWPPQADAATWLSSLFERDPPVGLNDDATAIAVQIA